MLRQILLERLRTGLHSLNRMDGLLALGIFTVTWEPALSIPATIVHSWEINPRGSSSWVVIAHLLGADHHDIDQVLFFL